MDVIEGDPAATLIEAAETGGYDLIVLGRSGYGALKEMVLGSVSRKVADGSSKPVLIVQ